MLMLLKQCLSTTWYIISENILQIFDTNTQIWISEFGLIEMAILPCDEILGCSTAAANECYPRVYLYFFFFSGISLREPRFFFQYIVNVSVIFSGLSRY